MFLHKLEELRQQFSTLQQFSYEGPGKARELLQRVLAGLQHSLEELETIVAEFPASERIAAMASARGNGERLQDARSGRGLRFRALAESSTVMVRIMGTEKHCRWANRAWLEYTGQSLKDLVGEGWLQNLHPEDRGRCSWIHDEAFDSSRHHRVEYRLRRKSGEYGWVLEIGTPRLTSRGTAAGYLGTAIEIDEQKRAETRLALHYTLSRLLSEAKTFDEAAPRILKLLGESLAWDVGELWSVGPAEGSAHFTHLWTSPAVDAAKLQAGSRMRVFALGAGPPSPADGPVWIADIEAEETLAGEHESQRLGLHGMLRLPISVHGEVRAGLRVFSLRVRTKDEAEIEFMAAVSLQIGQFLERKHDEERIRWSDAAARNGAEQEVKRYQDRLRSLMADLLLAEEHERRRLAVDLHDGLSQTIALTQIKLSALRSSMNGKLKRSLDEIEDLIDQTNRAARSISFELSPPVLHDLGLEPAVQWLIENNQERYGIEIALENDSQPKPTDEKTRVILFRSIRELLINAAKHAGARRVQVCLGREENHLNASVEDDGVGMEPDILGARGSGLFSIQERLSHVGGSMRIESVPGQGTKIRLCAPLTSGRSTQARLEA